MSNWNKIEGQYVAVWRYNGDSGYPILHDPPYVVDASDRRSAKIQFELMGIDFVDACVYVKHDKLFEDE